MQISLGDTVLLAGGVGVLQLIEKSTNNEI